MRIFFFLTLFVCCCTTRRLGNDLSLWIDEHQVKIFSGMSMEIYAIRNGRVQSYLLDPNLEAHLPVIPPEVGSVNFTWKSGSKKYFYRFDVLESFNNDILKPPIISIKNSGQVPRNPKVFSVLLPCSGNSSGIASFSIGLLIQSRKGKPLPGTPIRLNLRKECAHYRGQPDPECDKKCANGGFCNSEKICQCKEGYMGQYCRTALCYPKCVNNGTCTAPGTCSCPPGYQGRHCEGGICLEKCENGGKCIQKDTCDCPKGYYGLRCEFSKCIIPCVNGGKCKGVNKCRCPKGYGGNHCEVVRRQFLKTQCSRMCQHGACKWNNSCVCDLGWTGKYCQNRSHNKMESSKAFSDENSYENSY